MRQIGTALRLLADDRDGAFPNTTHIPATESWIITLKPYVGDVDEIRIDPADPNGADRLQNDGSSYVLNDYIAVPALGPFGNPKPDKYFGNLYRLDKPSQTITTFVAADGWRSDHVHARSEWLGGWDKVTNNIAPGRYGGDGSDATTGSSNYLFADTHVSTRSARDFKQAYDDLAADGINIAKPPQ